MSVEQKRDIISKKPTITDVLNASGMPSNSSNKRKLEKLVDHNPDLTSLIDSEGRIIVSRANFASLVTLASGLKEENSSPRIDSESAILPYGEIITARKIFPIREITEIITKAWEEQQPFSLEQIINASDPTPKRSDKSRAAAKKKALDRIDTYCSKIKPHGWAIDLVTRKEDKEGWKNPQFWFRRKDGPPFTPLPGTEVLEEKPTPTFSPASGSQEDKGFLNS